MLTQNSDLPPKPPSAFNALISGFNVITHHLALLLFPATLDIFLLFGPRLKIHDLFTTIFEEFIRLQAVTPTPFPVTAQADTEKILSNFNLFSNLRTYPLGLFSLLINNQSATSPLGTRIDWEIPNGLILVSAFILLTSAGLLFGSLYFYFVSRAALKPQAGPGLLRAIFHSLIVWTALTTATYLIAMPLLGILVALVMNNQIVTFIFFLLLAWPVTWMGLMVFFSTHGVYIFSKNAFTTLQQIFRILRHGMPPLGWFALIAIVMSQGMDLIWLTPTADTWMALVGIFGHAFISTGLLAASFIFYRDMATWVDEALAWLKTHQITSARA